MSSPGSKTNAASSSQAQAASGSQAEEKDAGPSQQSPQTSGSGSGAPQHMDGRLVTARSYIDALLHSMYQRTGWKEAVLATTIAHEAGFSSNRLLNSKMYGEQIQIHELLDAMAYLQHQAKLEVAKAMAKVVLDRENKDNLYRPAGNIMAEARDQASTLANKVRSSPEAAKKAHGGLGASPIFGLLNHGQLGEPVNFNFPDNYSSHVNKFGGTFTPSENAYNYVLITTMPVGTNLSCKLTKLDVRQYVPIGFRFKLDQLMKDTNPKPGLGTCKLLNDPGNPVLGKDGVTVVLLFTETNSKAQSALRPGNAYRDNLRKALADFRQELTRRHGNRESLTHVWVVSTGTLSQPSKYKWPECGMGGTPVAVQVEQIIRNVRKDFGGQWYSRVKAMDEHV